MQTLSVPGTPDRSVKRERVRSILEKTNADAIALTSAAAVSWYLDGARIHVNLAGDPIVWVRVSRDRDQVFVTSNELSRLNREELPSDIELNVRHWYQDLSITDALPEQAVEEELREARRNLLPYEADRYRKLGADTAEAMTQAIGSSYAQMSERKLAAMVAERLIERGADPLVLLVAGQARLDLRHPLPTDETLGRRALVVVCARRHGLIASASRWTTFGAANPADRDADLRIAQVEAAIFDATVPGAELGEILSVARRAYRDYGFGDEAWKAHHQGGATGYATRDPKATPGSLESVVAGQAFAWNPSAPGVKIEDTVIASAEGIEVLTIDKSWPTTVVSGRLRPATLAL
jgi:Xaa-Pro aminopeptidase